MSWVTLSCKCGHVDDLDKFCRTVVSGELPAGQFQCPGCGYAWRRRESEHRLIRAGSEAMIIPGKITLEACEARL